MIFPKNLPGWERTMRVVLGAIMIGYRLVGLPAGPLGYRMKHGAGGLQVDIDTGLAPPTGGLRVRWHGREQRIDRLPASITLED